MPYHKKIMRATEKMTTSKIKYFLTPRSIYFLFLALASTEVFSYSPNDAYSELSFGDIYWTATLIGVMLISNIKKQLPRSLTFCAVAIIILTVGFVKNSWPIIITGFVYFAFLVYDLKYKNNKDK